MQVKRLTAGLAESNGRLLLDIWRDSLHVTCGLTACTPGSAPGPTLGNEYGKTLPFYYYYYRIHPFNSLFSRTTWVSHYQKGKTNLDLNKARDDGDLAMQWHQLDHMQTTCTSLQTDNHTNASSLNFYRPTNSFKALKATHIKTFYKLCE